MSAGPIAAFAEDLGIQLFSTAEQMATEGVFDDSTIEEFVRTIGVMAAAKVAGAAALAADAWLATRRQP